MHLKLKAFFVFFVIAQSLLFATKTNKDTATAVVIYGNDVTIPELYKLTPNEARLYADSLKKKFYNDPVLLEVLEFYLSLGEMSKGDLINLIDSLFELDKVPYALVNQLNIFLATHQFPPEENRQEILDSALFHPSRYYTNADYSASPFGYIQNIEKVDSLVTLTLIGNEILQNYHSPLDKVVYTSSFGWRFGRMHNGVDLDLEVWDPVYAVFPGVVRFAKYYGGYGRVVIVRHNNGLETLYAHLHRIKVKEGDWVNAGDLLGLGGSSGNSTGSHLHFETRFQGVAFNPRNIIDFKNKSLVANRVIVFPAQQGFTVLPEGVNFHTVKKGDTLFEIARTYGTTCNKLCEINGIRRNDYLYVGQKIRVI